jgi:ankyrin repeat protein
MTERGALMVIEAIKGGDETRVREVLKEEPERAEERDENGVSALMLSHYHGVDAGEAIRAARSTPLDVFEAATVGDVDRLRTLLDEEPDLARARSVDDGTALHFAAFFNQPEAAQLLLERGAEIEAVASTFGNVRPLHSAVAADNTETARALLAAGADANARQGGGFTPLHGAAQNGNRELVEALLASGADPAATSDEGKSAVDFAAEKGHDQLAALLAGSD